MQASESLEKKLSKWEQLKDQLLFYKDAEMKMRIEIALEISKGVPGKFNIEGNGKDYVVASNESMKFDKEVYAQIQRHLTPADREAVKLTPSLDKKKVKQLSKDSVLWTAIYTEPSAPIIKVKGEVDEDE